MPAAWAALVMAGATKDTIKALPAFDYASDTTTRDRFVANAEKDIAKGHAKLTDLEKKAAAAASDAKVRIDAQVKAQAILDLANEKKRCEPYDVQISALNSRETTWSACCEGMAFKYIYYPEKCVVRKAAGPLTCEAVAPKPAPTE